ncbi:MAG TPA: hypothetical protein VHK90_04305, partial [Thermoanaerobaculia bacterium]|nr:hypothetical protein [Thermoanaerobaculia bacterium]
MMQVGAIAVVLASTALHAFELDRFFVPKELVLHLTAVLVAVMAARAATTRVDLWLLGFLALSGVSAIFATNPWLAMRALAITASSLVLFRAARAVPSEKLVHGLAVAVVATVATALLQAYGVETLFFSESRAPGGTLGNRNFVAHVAAFGAPLLLLSALRARRFAGYAIASIGAAVVIATLVLTRSRAAWLAAAVVLLVLLIGVMRARAWKRFVLIVVFAGAGAAAALLIPNTLRWRSDNPYVDSLTGVIEYDEGSGRGRL